jgi:hypothetical protein
MTSQQIYQMLIEKCKQSHEGNRAGWTRNGVASESVTRANTHHVPLSYVSILYPCCTPALVSALVYA